MNDHDAQILPFLEEGNTSFTSCTVFSPFTSFSSTLPSPPLSLLPLLCLVAYQQPTLLTRQHTPRSPRRTLRLRDLTKDRLDVGRPKDDLDGGMIVVLAGVAGRGASATLTAGAGATTAAIRRLLVLLELLQPRDLALLLHLHQRLDGSRQAVRKGKKRHHFVRMPVWRRSAHNPLSSSRRRVFFSAEPCVASPVERQCLQRWKAAEYEAHPALVEEDVADMQHF